MTEGKRISDIIKGKGVTPSTGGEVTVVPDFLSGSNNELMAYAEGLGEVRNVYGKGYNRLSRHTAPYPAPGTQGADTGAASAGKAYFQPDIMGSALIAADGQGNVLGYARRNVWGDPEQPQGDALDTGFGFTTYQYDPVIGKHFAQARFYDGTVGRMVSPDPVKRGLNGYPYCGNDPVDYVDPTGEVANILIGGLLGGAVGGVSGFAGSAVSQLLGGEKFDLKKALGSAAHGAVTGAVRGALVGSGAPVGIALAADFLAGTVGSTLEQKIGTGNADLRRSITGGLTNAVGGAIYGNSPLKNAGQALLRGGAAGAASSGINYLSDSLDTRKIREDALRRMAQGSVSPYARRSDLSGLCSVPDPFAGGVGCPAVRGYRYEGHTGTAGKGGFNLADFGKELLTGFVAGGLSSAAFYGAGKAVEAVKGSVRGVGKSGRDALRTGNSKVISSMSKKQLQANLPDGWTYTEHNGRVHIRDANRNFRVRIDPPDNVTNYQHMHILDEHENPLDINGNIVSPKSPDGHIPWGD